VAFALVITLCGQPVAQTVPVILIALVCDDQTPAGNNATESVVSFLIDIPVFSFVKYEMITRK